MAFEISKNCLFKSELPDFCIFLVNLILVNHVEIKCLGKGSLYVKKSLEIL
uniref:Uncharacterized protein n=1 Tax=Meloidogyne enterolobii TaxID=390850 RepID=A0A6V7WUH6_MELEN|nr:unnamed protein product [Meloidogyne enterolobii]